MYTLLIYGTFLDDIAPFCDEVGALFSGPLGHESFLCFKMDTMFFLRSWEDPHFSVE